jgi:hypothetical protein
VVSFALADASPATIEVLDLAGRRVESREVGAFGAGPHELALGEGREWAPGVYLLRLSRAGTAVTRKLAIVR